MKKILAVSAVLFLSAAVFVLMGSLPEEDVPEISKIVGYCPSMKSLALSLKEEQGVELIEFSSASGVFSALNAGFVDMALVGRKAEAHEKQVGLKENVLMSGLTLASREKAFIDYEHLPYVEIITYLPEENVSSLCPVCSVVYRDSKEEALEKAREGHAVLVSWDDWEDFLELVVVMKGSEKDMNFRGAFLYSY